MLDPPVKHSVLIGSFVAFQLLGAILIQLFLIRELGVGPETDVFVASQALPMVAGAILLAALQSVWLPRLSISVSDKPLFKVDLAIAQGQALWLSGTAVAILGVTSFWWIPFIFPTLSDQQLVHAKWFTLFFLVATSINCLAAVLVFALRAQHRFLLPEMIASAVTLLGLLSATILIPAYGLVAGVGIILFRSVLTYIALLYVCQWPAASGRKALRERAAWIGMRPVLSGALVYKASPLVDRYFASQSTAGGLTLFNLAMAAMGGASVVLERALCSPKAPLMASFVSRGDFVGARSLYRRGMLQIGILSLMTLTLLLAAQQPFQWISEIVLQIDASTSHQLWLFLLILTGYFFASAVGVLPVSLFHSMHNTWAPSRIGAIGVAVSIALKFFAFLQYGLFGLLLAISFHYLLTAVIMCFAVERCIHARIS